MKKISKTYLLKFFTKVISPIFFFTLIFVCPFIFTKIILHIDNSCFSIQITEEPNPQNKQKFSSLEFEDLFKSKLSELERVDGRLSKIVRYDLYFTNKTVAIDDYKKEKLPAKLICVLDASKELERQFEFNVLEKIGDNISLSDFSKSYKCNGIGAVFTLSARTLQPGETQMFPVGFRGCLSTEATRISYLFVYLIVFSLIIGIVITLKQGIKIIIKNWKYFID